MDAAELVNPVELTRHADQSNNETYEAIDSLRQGQWMNTVVIDKYLQLLVSKYEVLGRRCKAVPAEFFM